MPKPKPVKDAEASTADDLLISDAQKSWVILQEGQGSQLAHWLTLGRGLMAGRKKHPSNTAFAKWCMEAGFAFVTPDDRGDARWLAEHWGSIQDQIQPGHTHPHVIRAHLRKGTQRQDTARPVNNQPHKITPEEALAAALLAAGHGVDLAVSAERRTRGIEPTSAEFLFALGVMELSNIANNTPRRYSREDFHGLVDLCFDRGRDTSDLPQHPDASAFGAPMSARKERPKAPTRSAGTRAQPRPNAPIQASRDTKVPASMAGKTAGELKAIITLHPDAGIKADARTALEAMGAA